MKKDMLSISLILLIIVIAVGVGPLITLWAINALFQLQIAYTFLNWVAVVWLSSIAAGIASYGKK